MFAEVLRIIVAFLAGGLVVYFGIRTLRFVAQKAPDPPPSGSLRKVKLNYICTICMSEVQMKVAPVENPESPKHCGEEMNLLAPIED